MDWLSWSDLAVCLNGPPEFNRDQGSVAIGEGQVSPPGQACDDPKQITEGG